jgi:hypothetical protein
MVAVRPSCVVTCRPTLWSPAVSNRWLACSPEAEPPSSKVQAQAAIPTRAGSLEVLVNWMSVCVSGVVGAQAKSAIGSGPSNFAAAAAVDHRHGEGDPIRARGRVVVLADRLG